MQSLTVILMQFFSIDLLVLFLLNTNHLEESGFNIIIMPFFFFRSNVNRNYVEYIGLNNSIYHDEAQKHAL